ncbi:MULTISPECIES: hypothetical protein [unclassified Chryseobacterium]|uniref:hypothetical protein n=1 Tax=unclassified Chryseobacterium TaxID=2593645 RepID=UPI00100A7C62|nr:MULTISPECIES: hypothetical protein [unclassified Chryseobacterium]RXM52568.1 hypothetical protein BOQ64_06815 [Chryseobacterium sp. CH25]RXM66624.1 hypothetical protein BOQ60_01290 [Chryseobacterium sp. CH1]
MKKAFKFIGITLGILVLFLIASNFIQVNERESLLYKIQQYVTYNDEDWNNYETNQKILAENPVGSSQTTVAAVPVKDFHPYNIDLLTESAKKEELKKIENAHFENLVPAKKGPDDEDAQIALIKLTDRRLTDVIINQKLSVKIGKCYENPNKEENYSCVSCMILLYNREKKDWQEAPDGENFLDNSYDFYQTYEGGEWGAKGLSMYIPYDKDLFKKYEKK